jgi:signal transduction histidine kinase
MIRARDSARRLGICIGTGTGVALANSFLDASFYQRGYPSTAILINNCVIGAVVSLLIYLVLILHARKRDREVSLEIIRREAVLRERHRLAHEFHDNVARSLTGVIMQLEAADDNINRQTAAGKHSRRALDLARKGLREMRRSLQDLPPESLEQEDLTTAIAQVSEELTTGTSLKIQTSFTGIVRRLPSPTEVALLRICQEALANVIAHANASCARIELCFGAQDVRLCVTDDGPGFDPGQSKKSFGLRSMQQRAKQLGGEWQLQSKRGLGTRVYVSIPVSPAICEREA